MKTIHDASYGVSFKDFKDIDLDKVKYIKSHKKEEKDVEQEKQGTWFPRDPNLDGKIKIMCSECKKHFPINTVGDIPKYLYCPNCRAKMDTSFAQRVVNAYNGDNKIEPGHTSDYYKIKAATENWPDWKKKAAEELNKKGHYDFEDGCYYYNY